MERTFARVLLLLSLSAAFAKFIHIPEMKNWQEAQEYCRWHYTDLAPVRNTFDTRHLRLLTYGTRDLMWIGMQRNLTNRNEWTWSGGGVVSTFLWAPGEPSNGTLENHGAILDEMMHDADTTYYNLTFFCYSVVVVRERKTWEEALEHCREHHSDLASVVSDTEMMLIQKELNGNETTTRVWIGLRFLPGGWLWVDGQPLAYEAWGRGGKAECPDVKLRCAALQVTGGRRSGAAITHQVHGTGNDSQNGLPGVRVVTADVKVKEWEAHDCVERLYFVCN